MVKRRFITVGFAAFMLLIPLAATSTNAMIKRLGGKRWQWLHRLIYLIAPLGILHYWWMKVAKATLPPTDYDCRWLNSRNFVIRHLTMESYKNRSQQVHGQSGSFLRHQSAA